MKAKVIQYVEHEAHHLCRFEGKCFDSRIDLLVSGCFPKETTPESLVGKTIEIGWLHPYVEIAEDVALAAERGEEER